MAGDSTPKGMIDERPETDRDDLPFTNRPSSGIHDHRIVNTYGTLASNKIEKGRTIEKGTQEGAGSLPAGVVQSTTIARPTVGTYPAWNGQPAGGSGPGTTQMSRPSREDDDGSDGNVEGEEQSSDASSTVRKAAGTAGRQASKAKDTTENKAKASDS